MWRGVAAAIEYEEWLLHPPTEAIDVDAACGKSARKLFLFCMCSVFCVLCGEGTSCMLRVEGVCKKETAIFCFFLILVLVPTCHISCRYTA